MRHGIAKDQILASLRPYLRPTGGRCPTTGKLSDIVVTDGKVFFSITVDAAR